MKLSTKKLGVAFVLAFYATACSQPNNQSMNSGGNNPSAAITITPTPNTHEPDTSEEVLKNRSSKGIDEDLPEGWKVREIVEKDDLSEYISPCLKSKSKSSLDSHSIKISVYVFVPADFAFVVAAHALPDGQVDAEELKEAERSVEKLSFEVRNVSNRSIRSLLKPQKWHGIIEVKVTPYCSEKTFPELPLRSNNGMHPTPR